MTSPRPTLPTCIRVLCCSLLGACTTQDYGFDRHRSQDLPPDIPVDLRIDVAFQENQWGQALTRCQVQVAFAPFDAVQQQPGDRPQPTLPEEPGTCAFTELEAPASPVDVGSDEDDWQLNGDVVGPRAVYLADDPLRLLLEAVETDQEGLRYELPDCDAEHFPFSRTLGLDVLASEDPNGVHDLTMDELIAVGPRVVVDAPEEPEGGGIPRPAPGEDLAVRWTLDGADPEVEGEARAPGVTLKLLHQDIERELGDRWLICQPDEEGWFDIPAADLAQLAEGIDAPERWRTALDIHSEVQGRSQETPWGRLMAVRAHVSAGAPLDLSGLDP